MANNLKIASKPITGFVMVAIEKDKKLFAKFGDGDTGKNNIENNGGITEPLAGGTANCGQQPEPFAAHT